MATNSGNLVNALISGGLSAAAARVIANAIANASTPQFSRGGDISDATPATDLRLITQEGRKYQFGNLDYSSEAPLLDRLQSRPGQYTREVGDHPYKDAQPVQPVPPLAGRAVEGGDYITVDNTVRDNAPLATVSMKLSTQAGTHVRLNKSSKTCEAVPFTSTSPQGLVTATVQETGQATNLEMAVQQLQAQNIATATGGSIPVLSWPNAAGTAGTVWTPWAASNLFNLTAVGGLNTLLGISTWTSSNLLGLANQSALNTVLGISSWASSNLLGVGSQSALNTVLGVQTGTWTPVYKTYTGGASPTMGTDPTFTYDTQAGWYFKFQRLVFAGGRIVTTARPGNGSGASLGIGGLPFNFNAQSGGPAQMAAYFANYTGMNTYFTHGVVTETPSPGLLRLFTGTPAAAVEQQAVPASGTAGVTFGIIYTTNS